jgi:hypothetical protein
MMVKDWYEARGRLREGMIFTLADGDVICLDRRVPGDGTKWYNYEVESSFDKGVVLSYWGGTVEPSDLVELLADNEHEYLLACIAADNMIGEYD